MMAMAAIMQPTYLPWLGYFDLMDQSDAFVFLDSVQFDKRSWQQRNKIKTPTGELLITIPVYSKGKFFQKICDVQIDPTTNFYDVHIRTIEQNYARAKFFKNYIRHLKDIYTRRHCFLSQLTTDIIIWMKEVLGIQAKIFFSSTFNFQSNKTELLVDICKEIKATSYISPLRSREYIQSGKSFTENAIDIYYHQYDHPQYNQLFGSFIPFLSALDLLFNEGEQSLSVIRMGRRQSIKGDMHSS